MEIGDVFGLDVVKVLAGPRSFARGLAYAQDDRVRELRSGHAEVTATVHGSEPYAVHLWANGAKPGHACSCPMGRDGAFCKHCVAVALMAFHPPSPDGIVLLDPLPEREMIEAYLLAQDTRTLAGLVLERAEEDEFLRGRLLVRAARWNASPADVATYWRAIDDVLNPGGFVHYREMYDYARGVDAVIDGLDDLMNGGHADEAVELIEHALARLDEAVSHVDDSDGYLSEIKERLTGLHVEACERGSPDPEALAGRLYRFALESELETFLEAARTHGSVLGPAGLDAYRGLAERDWVRVKPRPPGARFELDSWRFRVTYIMETLAEVDGDVDALVSVKSRDLSNAFQFLGIAEALSDAGRREEALDWAERGVRAFPERTDHRLREFLADAYQGLGRHDEAMSLIWEELVERPMLASYELLCRHAEAASVWPIWRERAIGHLRSIATPAAAGRHTPVPRWGEPEGHSTLVSVFLWEGDADTAWAEAVEGGCRHELWMRLAELREREHPDDAIEIYQRDVERTIDAKNNRAYAEAVDRMKRIERVMDRAGRRDDFAPYVASVRAANRPKRNLMKLFDTNGW